jgi:hypothetical protein
VGWTKRWARPWTTGSRLGPHTALQAPAPTHHTENETHLERQYTTPGDHCAAAQMDECPAPGLATITTIAKANATRVAKSITRRPAVVPPRSIPAPSLCCVCVCLYRNGIKERPMAKLYRQSAPAQHAVNCSHNMPLISRIFKLCVRRPNTNSRHFLIRRTQKNETNKNKKTLAQGGKGCREGASLMGEEGEGQKEAL